MVVESQNIQFQLRVYIKKQNIWTKTKTNYNKLYATFDVFSLLLKELFDVTLESDGDREMTTFDAESRSFGRKNILNHLSLLDRYFDEFQKKLSTQKS